MMMKEEDGESQKSKTKCTKAKPEIDTVSSVDVSTSDDDSHDEEVEEKEEDNEGKEAGNGQDIIASNTKSEPSSDASHKRNTSLEKGIASPNPNDVIFGRGRPYQIHQGNILLHQLVHRNQAEYVKSRRLQKTRIARKIVYVIKELHKGRFLRKSGDDLTWEEVDDETARDKVSHALRGKIRNDRARRKEERENAAHERMKRSSVPSSSPQRSSGTAVTEAFANSPSSSNTTHPQSINPKSIFEEIQMLKEQRAKAILSLLGDSPNPAVARTIEGRPLSEQEAMLYSGNGTASIEALVDADPRLQQLRALALADRSSPPSLTLPSSDFGNAQSSLAKIQEMERLQQMAYIQRMQQQQKELQQQRQQQMLLENYAKLNRMGSSPGSGFLGGSIMNSQIPSGSLSTSLGLNMPPSQDPLFLQRLEMDRRYLQEESMAASMLQQRQQFQQQQQQQQLLRQAAMMQAASSLQVPSKSSSSSSPEDQTKMKQKR